MPNAFRAVRTTIASLWMWTLLIVLVVIVTPLNVLWRIFGAPFDRVNYYGGRLFRLLGVFIVTCTPRWRFDVRGTPPPDPRLPYVVIANHESFADMLLLCHLPWEMKWLSKASIMKVPFFGWLMWRFATSRSTAGWQAARGQRWRSAATACQSVPPS